jgi:hypothetical protein
MLIREAIIVYYTIAVRKDIKTLCEQNVHFCGVKTALKVYVCYTF